MFRAGIAILWVSFALVSQHAYSQATAPAPRRPPQSLPETRPPEDNWNAQRIDRELGAASAWAEKHHVYITSNEFGAFRKVVKAGDRVTWLQDMRLALEKHSIGWTMWDYAGGFAVVNKVNGQAQGDPEVLKALGLH